MLGLFRMIKLMLMIIDKLRRLIELVSQIEKNQKLYVVPVETPIWLDNQDMMQKLHISERTLRRRRADGSITSVRIKGKYYYRMPDSMNQP